MNDFLRCQDQYGGMTFTKHFEDFLRHGITLPGNHSSGLNDRQLLQDTFFHWKNQEGLGFVPPRSVILLINSEFIVSEFCSNGLANEQFPPPGAFWDRSVHGDTFLQTNHQESSAISAGAPGLIAPIMNSAGDSLGFLGLYSCNLESDKLIGPLYAASFSLTTGWLLFVERYLNDQLTQRNMQSERESRKQEVLFEASKKVHAQINVDAVLNEVIESIHSVYPKIEVDLLLSQDSHSTNLPVKPLDLHGSEDDICSRSFIEGHLIFEPTLKTDGPSYGNIAVPLSGKQGVYGVLHLRSEHDLIHASDLQFFSVLADAAGSAFENAKLYEQSNYLINELRLINEITKRLNQSLRLNEIFNFASSELLTIFGADYSCILQTEKETNKLIVQASNMPALFHEVFALDEGFSGLIFTKKEPILISDYWENAKVQSRLMEMCGARSLIGTPILVNDQVVGVIMVVHRKPNFFSYDNYKLLQVLAGHIGLAVSNASLHAEVRRMVITDNLTGLYARHYLDEQANLMQKKDFCGSLIVVDIDNFKRVNDTYGHQVGDQILIQVSQIIKSSIRDTDIAARWGGEELAIYLPQVSKEQTLRVAERIRLRVMQETTPQVTVSCGVSDWNWGEDKISVESLFYRADMALYKAKNNGRNQIQIG